MIEASLKVPKGYRKSLPAVTPLAKPFWDATTRHELTLQRCKGCGTYQWYPKPWCIDCGSRDLEWTKVSGHGKVFSYTIIRQVVQNMPGFGEDLPFVLASIELDEGPRMIAQLSDLKPEEAKIGMDVVVTFADATQEVSIPKFKPA
jgi:hypothetical protein